VPDDWGYFKYFEIQKGWVIVDLGAHIGTATQWFSNKVGKDGLVVAVEPAIESFKCLIEATISMRLYNTLPVFCAIGHESRQTNLYVSDEHPRASSTVIERPTGFVGRVRKVPVISWDELVELVDVNHVHIAKINIEGAEIDVFGGMTKVFPDKLIIEEHKRNMPENYMDDFMKILGEKGYKIIEMEDWFIYAVRE